MNCTRFTLLMGGWLLLFIIMTPIHALAGELAVWEGEIEGVPVWITVIPRGHQIDPQKMAESPWWEWGNTQADAYLFAFEDPQDVYLILSFSTQPNGTAKADLYLNELGSKPLDYSLTGDELKVLSNGGNPYLIVQSESGYWLTEEGINYDLTILIDGPYTGYFGAQDVKTDGVINTEIKVGADSNGIPQWQTNQFINDIHPEGRYPRFISSLRLQDSPPFKIAKSYMPTFPYLGIGKVSINYFEENPNPIYFNLENYQIKLNHIPGFQNGGMYRINSLVQPPDLDFENPFVFYSFNPEVRYAHLAIRGINYHSGDYHELSDLVEINRSSFRYSWKVKNDIHWDYGIYVAGFYPYEDQFMIGGTLINGIQADDLPGFVTDQVWPFITFIDAPDGYGGSEGMYWYSTQNRQSWDWIAGLDNEPPSFLSTPYLQETRTLTDTSSMALPLGFRGEYNSHNKRIPTLYFSPIDNRLHLLGAKGGIWYLDESTLIRLHNFSGSNHIDAWIKERIPDQEIGQKLALPGEFIESLYTYQDMIIYSGNRNIQLLKTDIKPSTFEITPPKDEGTWRSFSDSVMPYIVEEHDPANLMTWLEPFPGVSLVIRGGGIQDFRLTEKGYRFILQLDPGYNLEGSDLVGLGGLVSGEYVVAYNGTGFTVRPLTPAAVSIAYLALEAEAGTPLHLGQWASLRGELHNQGLADLHDLEICAYFAGPLDETQVLTTTVALLAGESSQLLHLPWAPPSAGVWQITVGSGCQTEPEAIQGPSHVLASTTIDVQPPQGPPAHWLLTLGGLLAETAACLLVIFFVAIALLAGGVTYLWTRTSLVTDQAEENQ